MLCYVKNVFPRKCQIWLSICIYFRRYNRTKISDHCPYSPNHRKLVFLILPSLYYGLSEKKAIIQDFIQVYLIHVSECLYLKYFLYFVWSKYKFSQLFKMEIGLYNLLCDYGWKIVNIDEALWLVSSMPWKKKYTAKFEARECK